MVADCYPSSCALNRTGGIPFPPSLNAGSNSEALATSLMSPGRKAHYRPRAAFAAILTVCRDGKLARTAMLVCKRLMRHCWFFQAEDGIRYWSVTGVQTCA